MLPEIIEEIGISELPGLPKLQGLPGYSTQGDSKVAELPGFLKLYGDKGSSEPRGLPEIPGLSWLTGLPRFSGPPGLKGLIATKAVKRYQAFYGDQGLQGFQD